jgi:cyclophilin family peptidyl-prolyl cis-trans isomerase/HEAT repeat protein
MVQRTTGEAGAAAAARVSPPPAGLPMRLVTALSLTALGACATVPAAPSARLVPYEQKMAWILQLEDQRLLHEPPPEPPASVPPEGRRAAPPPAPTATADLAALAGDSDPRVRRRAAVAIGRVGLSEGIPALTPLLADMDPDVRHAALFAMGLIGDTSAAPFVLPLLADQDPLVRGRAAEALGLMGAVDAAAAISTMTAEYARSAAVASMEADDERWPAPAEAEAFKLGVFALVRLRAYEPLAAAVLDGGGHPRVTWWPVAYALQRIEDARAAPALKVLTGVTSRYTAAFAARGLGHAVDAAAADVLLPLIDPAGRPREVVASAIRAAGQLGATAAVGRLAEIAADVRQDPNLRILAVSTLGVLEAPDGMPIVLDLVTDEWPALRAAALRAAAAIDPNHFTLILSGLEIDRHWIGRAALADALGSLPADIALERLMPLLQDPDRRVIPNVLRALVRLEAPGVERVLLDHLQQADYVIRQTAAALIGESKPAGALAALQAAYREGEADATYGARAAAIEGMAAYGEDALEGVRTALADRDWAVRVRAVELLAKLDPSQDYRLAARPAPGTPPAPYDDPALLAPRASPHVFIDTTKGTIQFELAVLDAPQTTRNFMALARRGFFNGLPVHRVEANFVIQDGDPRGDGTGGPGYSIRDELNDRPFVRGTVGMARAWRDTGGSQFFITHSPQPHLDGRYTAFGHVINGMDVVDRIQVGDVIQRIRVWDGEAWD